MHTHAYIHVGKQRLYFALQFPHHFSTIVSESLNLQLVKCSKAHFLNAFISDGVSLICGSPYCNYLTISILFSTHSGSVTSILKAFLWLAEAKLNKKKTITIVNFRHLIISGQSVSQLSISEPNRLPSDGDSASGGKGQYFWQTGVASGYPGQNNIRLAIYSILVNPWGESIEVVIFNI